MSATNFLPANQQDQSARIYGRLTKGWSRALMEINVARLSDSLTYAEFDRTGVNISRMSGFNSVVNSAGITGKWYLNKEWSFDAGSEMEILTAKGSSFTEHLMEFRSSVFGSARFQFKNFRTIAGVRQVFVINHVSRTLFNLMGSFTAPLLNLTFKGQVSNKFRLPTFNERYWQPGGNPDLLPETGIGYDAGIEWNSITGSNGGATITLNAFYQDIENWVQWVPAGTYWSPRNIRNVKCQGFDATTLLKYQIGPSRFSLKGFYSYTESLDLGLTPAENNRQRQLPYIPLNQFLVKGTYDIDKFGLLLSYRYTGMRFTTDDHDPWLMLPPIHLIDAGACYNLQFKSLEARISFRVNNITNYSYQLIRAYPAPGRSFLLTVNLLFNQKNAEYAKE
jgi:iron complex outermembrane receptor protein